MVVEAALRSGALNTATWANGCLRVVMAVPGPVTSPLSAGTHRLLRDSEAVLVTGADEVLATLAPFTPPAGSAQPGGAQPGGAQPGGAQPGGAGTGGAGSGGSDALPFAVSARDPRDGLDESAALVLDALAPLRATGLAHVLAATGLTPGGALAALGRLGAAGVTESVEGGWRLSAATRTWYRRARSAGG